jgi:hypothetical protein
MGWRAVCVAFVCVCFVAAASGSVASGSATSARFEPSSVTFVSLAHGWAVGTVGCGSSRCWTLRSTADGGRTWSAERLPAALLAAADRRYSSAAAEYAVTSLNVRFADARDGWVYGGVPVRIRQSGFASYESRAILWSTHDGGRHWAQQPLRGLGTQDTILDLEAARGTAWLMESNARDGVTVRRTPVGRDDWTVAPTPLLGSPAGGLQQTGDFVLAGGAGWLVEGNDRGTTGRARLSGGRWVSWTPPCAHVGDSFAVPAAASSDDLVAVCVMGGFADSLGPSAPRGATLGSSWLYFSNDGGVSFKAGPELARDDFSDPAATGGPIASPIPDTILIGRFDPRTNGRELIASFDGGRDWAILAAGLPIFLGFTSPSQGVAILQSANGTTSMIMSYDGGHHWAPVSF